MICTYLLKFYAILGVLCTFCYKSTNKRHQMVNNCHFGTVFVIGLADY